MSLIPRPSGFNASITITHIGTATSIIDIDGIKFLTDPVFSPAGTQWERPAVILKVDHDPALSLKDLPPIDAVLLSHEDHPDNLDELGRRLLDGRRVLTTNDGANKLSRPGVVGLSPWETYSLDIGQRRFDITASPCQHVPGGECIGFVISCSEFGQTNGKQNAVWFTGDTIYMEEHKKIAEKFHVVVSLMNLGSGNVGGLQITLDGRQAVQLYRGLQIGAIIPMHYEWWEHFHEKRPETSQIFAEEGIAENVYWLEPGQPRRIL
ncbi:beta-lactamase superfamily domain-containing protein [Stachybotrys elegans]|uniref:Beta-lactamase superfamily domain-containing protein n=1 Tax=Stachybotrys elegans TaxID=80388 RepID=A0A8K0SE32_9HYPO|nr:beta-lactamase superfamily domain-containing protein [Stachybotrys elegans]